MTVQRGGERPIVSLGGVQPSLVRKKDGTIVAWMRDNGLPTARDRRLVRDEGMTWTQGEDSRVPNPGSKLEVVALRDGSWLDGPERHREREGSPLRLAVADEGRTWPHRRAIEDTPGAPTPTRRSSRRRTASST